MAQQHAPRYIIEVQSLFDGKWSRSENKGLTKAFFDRTEAENAIKPEAGLVSNTLKYRIRRK
jgi:hypothetical protein